MDDDQVSDDEDTRAYWYSQKELIQHFSKRLALPLEEDETSSIYQLFIENFIDSASPKMIGEALELEKYLNGVEFAESIEFYSKLNELLDRAISYFMKEMEELQEEDPLIENEKNKFEALKKGIPILKQVQAFELKFLRVKHEEGVNHSSEYLRFEKLAQERLELKQHLGDLANELERLNEMHKKILDSITLEEGQTKESFYIYMTAKKYFQLSKIFSAKRVEYITGIKIMVQFTQNEITEYEEKLRNLTAQLNQMMQDLSKDVAIEAIEMILKDKKLLLRNLNVLIAKDKIEQSKG